MIEGCSIRGEKKSRSLFFFFSKGERDTRRNVAPLRACATTASRRRFTPRCVEQPFFPRIPVPLPLPRDFTAALLPPQVCSSSSSLRRVQGDFPKAGWLAGSPIFPWVSFSPRMCAAVITILGRGRGGRGGRLEAKAHAFRRGNLWENEEERREKKENKGNEKDVEFCFRSIGNDSLELWKEENKKRR